MKNISLVLFLCFIFNIYCTIQMLGCESTKDYDTEKISYVEVSHKSADDCKNRLTDEDKKDGDKCCYRYGSKKKDEGYCYKLDKYEYENIGKLFKIWKLQEEIYKDKKDDNDGNNDDYGEIHIDCYSCYIKYGLILITLILF